MHLPHAGRKKTYNRLSEYDFFFAHGIYSEPILSIHAKYNLVVLFSQNQSFGPNNKTVIGNPINFASCIVAVMVYVVCDQIIEAIVFT